MSKSSSGWDLSIYDLHEIFQKYGIERNKQQLEEILAKVDVESAAAKVQDLPDLSIQEERFSEEIERQLVVMGEIPEDAEPIEEPEDEQPLYRPRPPRASFIIRFFNHNPGEGAFSLETNDAFLVCLGEALSELPRPQQGEVIWTLLDGFNQVLRTGRTFEMNVSGCEAKIVTVNKSYYVVCNSELMTTLEKALAKVVDKVPPVHAFFEKISPTIEMQRTQGFKPRERVFRPPPFGSSSQQPSPLW